MKPRKVYRNYGTACYWRPKLVWQGTGNSLDQSPREHTDTDRSLGGIGHRHSRPNCIDRASNRRENCRRIHSHSGHKLDRYTPLCIDKGMNPRCFDGCTWRHDCFQRWDIDRVDKENLKEDCHSTRQRIIHKLLRWYFANSQYIDPFLGDNFGLDHCTDRT